MRAYHEQMFPNYQSKFSETDPEFIELFDNFAFDEVVTEDDLAGKTRFMAILAALIGCQGFDEFRVMLPAVLNFEVTPVAVKEIVYQATAYLGIGREPQLTSHAAANMRIGNDKEFLIKIISQCLPFIGYPRSLNALRCVNEAAEK